MIAFLDTCVVIDALRERKPHYRKRMQEVVGGGDRLVISSFVLHELVYGAMISARPEMQLELIDRFVERSDVEPWTAEDAIAAARVRADLKAAGAPLNAIDVLIAGQAVSRGWSVVTSNVQDFIRVPGLTLIDWSDPAGAREINQATRADWMLAHLRRPPKEFK